MLSLAPSLDALLKSLPPRPVGQKTLDDLVRKTLNDSKNKSSLENRKSQWEYLLKNDIFELAATEGTALGDHETSYYDDLQDKLDLILTFTEHDACEQTFPFIVLQDLLETQTITSCSHIFSWIEARAQRLTDGMVPQKGKALILLRTLNDLLRRLSKMGSTTLFCGRILTFLSGVFPLGERSGVNLRGEYGPVWEGVKIESREAKKANEMEGEGDKMLVDEVKSDKEEKKEDFYNTFWSLQLPFSRPPLFANPSTFLEFKDAVNKVFPVIKEATAKERAMMGSRSTGSGSTGSLKRKREPEIAGERNSSEYFFAKFLTSPDLLDLEVADAHFRRQFIFQLLILLNHLLTFTKAAKSVWSTSRNRSLQMDFTLEGPDAQWVQEMVNKAMEELRQTTPNGRAFTETVNVILEREKNWVKWKNELCAPFDKEPWAEEVNGERVTLEEATKATRQKMREDPKDWEWKLGSQPLSEIWEMGYRDLSDLQTPFQPGDVKDFVKKVNLVDARIELRKKALARSRAKLNAPKTAPTPIITETPAPTSKNTLSLPESNLPTPETLVAPSPRPIPSSPLHPSLPPKPGTPVKLLPSSQDNRKDVAPAPVSVPSPVLPVPAVVATAPPDPVVTASAPVLALADEQISKYEESKQRWAWLCLRTARDQYLQHFGKIGTGDIVLLAEEIEKERKEREKILKGEDMLPGTNTTAGPTGNGDEVRESSAKFDDVKMEGAPASNNAPDAEGDIKMEER